MDPNESLTGSPVCSLHLTDDRNAAIRLEYCLLSDWLKPVVFISYSPISTISFTSKPAIRNVTLSVCRSAVPVVNSRSTT